MQEFNVFMVHATELYGNGAQKTCAQWYAQMPFQNLVNTNGFKDIGDRNAQGRFWNTELLTWEEFTLRFNKCSFRIGQQSGPLFTDDLVTASTSR